MWKTAILSRASAFKIVAVILVSVAAVSTTVFVYKDTIFAGFQGTRCPYITVPFQTGSMPPRTVYQIFPPGKATICFTGHVQGQLPPDGLSLVPNIVLRNGYGFSACGYGLVNCGGVNVSASPARIFSSPDTVHVVATINVPIGSTQGDYWVFFAPGCTAAVLSLKIGDHTEQSTSSPVLECPFPSFWMGVTFNSYNGMLPVYQNGTIPTLL